MTKGFLQEEKREIAFETSSGCGTNLTGEVNFGNSNEASTLAINTSPGKSRKTGPGLPEIDALTAL